MKARNGRSTFSSLILHPFGVVRVERFELITKLILSQPPLPIGLHARVEVGARGRIRTFTVQILNLPSPAHWTTRALPGPVEGVAPNAHQ